MASPKLIIVTIRSYSRAKSKEKYVYGKIRDRNVYLHCPKCKKECKVGQSIITKRNKNNTKWYHKSCAESLNIVWSNDK